MTDPDYEILVCVNHWNIHRAWRKDPYAAFGFTACPVEGEHHVLSFVAYEETGENDREAVSDDR